MRPRALLLVLTLVAGGAIGCGDDEKVRPAAAKPLVASATLGVADRSQPLFTVPRLGVFVARCHRGGTATVTYRVADRSATQLVTATARSKASHGFADPGESMSIRVGSARNPRVDWHVAILSEGDVRVATASFTSAAMTGSGGQACFVTGRGDVTAGQR